MEKIKDDWKPSQKAQQAYDEWAESQEGQASIQQMEKALQEVEKVYQFFNVESLSKARQLWGQWLDMEPEEVGEHDLYEIMQMLQQQGHDVPEPFKVSIEALKHINPKHHKIPIHKLINQMVMEDFATDGTIEQLGVGKYRGKKVVTEASLLMAWESDNVTVPKRFTLEDRTVHDAVCSLLEGGNKVITPKMVYNQMMGNDLGKHVRPETEDKIIQSLRKCQLSLMEIDFTKEAAFRRMKDVKQTVLKRYILPLDEIEVTNRKGTKQRAYRLIETPPLFEYAKANNQIISIPQKVHKRDRLIKMSDHAKTIEHYLYRRIEVMRKNQNGKQDRTIKIKTLFAECQLQGDRVQQKRWRDMSEKLLDTMQQVGFIGDYRIRREGKGNPVTAYEILLDERPE